MIVGIFIISLIASLGAAVVALFAGWSVLGAVLAYALTGMIMALTLSCAIVMNAMVRPAKSASALPQKLSQRLHQ